jgi:hypothetical protein
MIDHACCTHEAPANPANIIASEGASTCVPDAMTSQLRSYWCFADDGLLPRYVMQTTVRFCTSAKQDDVEHFLASSASTK